MNFTKNLDEKTKIFIEIPEASLMIKNLRYDQIFHQHYHYFTLCSKTVNQQGILFLKSLNKKYWGVLYSNVKEENFQKK